MSAAEVEKVRRGFASFNRGDIEAMLTVVHPEIELVPLSAKMVDGRVYRGHDGVREWDRQRAEVWDLRFEPTEFEDLDGRVLVHGVAHSRGRAAGVEIETPVTWAFDFEAGLIIRLEAFLDRAEARAGHRA